MTDTLEMLDHWWWRPGWKVGRSFYTWHFTFESKPNAHALVDHYRPLLDRFGQLDQVGVEGLHLTVQGLGFVDEVSRNEVDRIVEEVRPVLANLQPISVTVGPAHADSETVQMPVVPLEQLAAVRVAVRKAIAQVWGPENVPEKADGFRPHVTLAYSNSAWPATELVRALNDYPSMSVDLEIDAISLIDLNRDAKRYEWAELAKISLGR
ncbi:2'-5' RNA ligase family protein [Actinokineospora sp. NPDC004072]